MPRTDLYIEECGQFRNQFFPSSNPERLAGDLLFARLTPSTALGATTWSAVLNSLEAVAQASGEISSTPDIGQLRSLCEVMETHAFLPARVEELTNLEVPRRLVGLADLIRDLSEQAVATGLPIAKVSAPNVGGTLRENRSSRRTISDLPWRIATTISRRRRSLPVWRSSKPYFAATAAFR